MSTPDDGLRRRDRASAASAPSSAGAVPPPAVEPPSPDVAPVGAESSLPGAHRGGFERWPTAPIGVEQTAGPVDAPDTGVLVQWAPAEPRAPYRGLAGWALAFAVVALAVSTLVGWGFPIGLIAIVTALVAFRRPLESRGMATWALVLGLVSLIYSAGWLWFAASRTDLFT